ncbi:MAG TPA: glycosyltransferase family 2 protein, partial [Candidatus Bathyarchaeota archaeon]|nr:glycosyltransferase family 2 protein [Candidatus Bathyarchaeota archaeon]
MSKKVSVFIPVYRESPFLESLLDSLVNDPYEDKEIHVVIDEPTDKSIETSRRFLEYVHFIFNGKRKGKANVLNELAKHATGDIFLFLDSDIIIKDDGRSFLETVVEEMNDADIIEIKKDV